LLLRGLQALLLFEALALFRLGLRVLLGELLVVRRDRRLVSRSLRPRDAGLVRRIGGDASADGARRKGRIG
jgi:hypothetical protein